MFAADSHANYTGPLATKRLMRPITEGDKVYTEKRGMPKNGSVMLPTWVQKMRSYTRSKGSTVCTCLACRRNNPIPFSCNYSQQLQYPLVRIEQVLYLDLFNNTTNSIAGGGVRRWRGNCSQQLLASQLA